MTSDAGTAPDWATGANPIHLDCNATTPVDLRVVQTMLPISSWHFGNPSSRNGFGQQARRALGEARAQVAGLLGAPDPASFVVTGSGSEADALAIRGAVLAALAAEPRRWTRRRPRVVTQQTVHRLPHTLNASIDGIAGETLLAAATGVAASTGSACHSGHTDPSPVLTAMGIPRDQALGAVRLSLGRWTTMDDVEAAVTLLAAAATGSPA